MSERVTETGLVDSGRTPAGDVLTELVLAVFPLHGKLLEASEQLARPAGLTAARWQVLGAVLHEGRTVSAIARVMGLTRQSVQRVADVLVGQGLAEYLDNPGHRRAKLLRATAPGLTAVRSIHSGQVAWADRVAADLEPDALRQALDTLERVRAALEADRGAAADP